MDAEAYKKLCGHVAEPEPEPAPSLKQLVGITVERARGARASLLKLISN